MGDALETDQTEQGAETQENTGIIQGDSPKKYMEEIGRRIQNRFVQDRLTKGGGDKLKGKQIRKKHTGQGRFCGLYVQGLLTALRQRAILVLKAKS